MSNWDWEEIWQAVGVALVLVFATLVVTFTLATKNVDYYYLTRNSSDVGICVQAHWTWRPDTPAFCTDDSAKALDFAAKANATLGKK